jgi:5-methylcytosine-specific restriction endonuclease McrA
MRHGPWDDCEDSYGFNRQKRCVGCGTPLTGRQEIWCSVQCGEVFWDNHAWTNARKARLKLDHYRCVRCGAGRVGVGQRSTRGGGLEVNHKTPVLGKHGKNGCWHHLDGLETLCRDCHLKETADQHKAGLLKKSSKRA